jgi:hypothetical protein
MPTQEKRVFKSYFQRWINYLSTRVAPVVASIPIGADEAPLFTDENPAIVSLGTAPCAHLAATTEDALVTLIAGEAGKRIKVRGLIAVSDVVSTVQFLSKPAVGESTAISGAFPMAANGGFVLPIAPDGQTWFETAEGAGLELTQGADATLALNICYVIE